MVMGAENSVLQHVKIIDSNAGVKLNWWTCYSAECSSRITSRISLFQSSTENVDSSDDIGLHNGASQNLKVLRHPAIVKYIGSGITNDRFYIVTEEVSPLKTVLKNEISPFAVCAGLHNILNALAFLHDTYGACHNNLDLDAITVSSNGTWKLFGMEFLRKHSECTSEFLKKTKPHRNKSIISPEENSDEGVQAGLGSQRDIYSFGVTAKSIMLQVEGMCDFPGAKDFLRRIDEELLCTDTLKRPSAAALLTDAFFRNDFIDILTDVKNITLKSSDEKREFFRGVGERLLLLPEELIATQLLDYFLARVVLVDPCVETFLPWILRPKRENHLPALFTVPTFSEHVVPRICAIFEVHDTSIRLVLLDHFKYFADIIPKDTLTKSILPQVLLGLKDKNDTLVANSLDALAVMVRLVGGETVIGGERNKHFFEGNPKESVPCVSNSAKMDTRPKRVCHPPAQPGKTKLPAQRCTLAPGDDPNALLQERSSPDGGEATTATVRHFAEDEEEWSDWEGLYVNTRQREGKAEEKVTEVAAPSPTLNKPNQKEWRKKDSATGLGLGTEFDVKSVEFQKIADKEDDIFASMEPVITFESSKVVADDGQDSSQSAKFHVQINEQDAHGWDVDSE